MVVNPPVSSKPQHARVPVIVGGVNLAFLPFDTLTALWILSGVLLLGIIATVFLLRKHHHKKSGLSRAEEKDLWQRLEQAAKERMATSSRIRVDDLATDRKKAETTGSARRPADSARSVSALFETLREDRPSGSQAEATGSSASAYPTPTHDHEPLRSSSDPRYDPGQRQGATWHDRLQSTPGPDMTYPTGKTMIDTPGLPLAPMSGRYPSSSLQHARTLDAPLADLMAPLGDGRHDLASAIRFDTTNRLEADLSWVAPATTKPPEWAPPVLRRAQAEKQARRYHRFSRQVALVKHLMHSPDADLQRKGVEVAIRLEQALHAERAKNRRGRRSLRK